jgi:mRNA-degrading endonuclease YafQ of YafQ-DinJ toxin-antitoxin module
VEFIVKFKNKKVLNLIQKMPTLEQKKLVNLIDDLKTKGPIQTGWNNFSQLGKNKFHCHLSYKWVACWKYIEDEEIKIIEVYYAGSRENAPY